MSYEIPKTLLFSDAALLLESDRVPGFGSLLLSHVVTNSAVVMKLNANLESRATKCFKR